MKFLNDFVANGYGVVGLKSEQDISNVYMPKTGVSSNNMKLLIGVGTSLGVCFIAREN